MDGKALITTLVLLLAGPAFAQDYDPSLSAHESMSQQQFSTQQTEIANHMLRESVRRNNRGGPTEGQVAACAQKSKFRTEYGADHPKVQRLYNLCRGIGR